MNDKELLVIAKFILDREKEVRSMEEQLQEYTLDIEKAKKENKLLKEMFEKLKNEEAN